MQIQLKNKLLCTMDEAQLSDVYQLLGKYTFTFHLNKAEGVLNIMNPLQGCCVVLESKMTEVVDRLFYPVQSILSEVGLNVTIVESERDRKQVLSRPNTQQQGIWIHAVPDEGMEVSIHYFLNHMKQAKRLSQILMMNMMKYADIPIRRTGLNWKSYSYKIPLFGHPWTSVALAYGGFSRLSVEQLSLLGHAITRGVASYFSNLPVLDMVEQLRGMEKMKTEVTEAANTATCQDHLATKDDEFTPSLQNTEHKERVDLGDTEEPTDTSDNKANCIVDDEHMDDQEDINEHPQPLTECGVREPEDDNTSTDPIHVEQKNNAEEVEPDQAGKKEQVSSKYSTFAWLQANMDNKEADAIETMGEQPPSLLIFMNKQLLATQERKKEEQSFNLMTMLREKKKHEQSSSEKS